MRSLIFSKFDRGETDELVRFFSRELGWLRGIAKNSRKSRIRFAGHLETFSLVELSLRNRQKDEMVWIDDSYVIHGFLGVRKSVEQVAIATLFFDIARVFLQENNPDERVFDFLTLALGSLDKGLPELTFVTLDGLRLLGLLGFQLQLQGCAVCGRELKTGEDISYSHEMFSVAHTACLIESDNRNRSISWETLSVMRKSFELPRESYSRLRLNRNGLLELTSIFKDSLRHLMGYELNSLQFIERMKVLRP